MKQLNFLDVKFNVQPKRSAEPLFTASPLICGEDQKKLPIDEGGRIDDLVPRAPVITYELKE